jgi:hypothetical protein
MYPADQRRRYPRALVLRCDVTPRARDAMHPTRVLMLVFLVGCLPPAGATDGGSGAPGPAAVVSQPAGAVRAAPGDQEEKAPRDTAGDGEACGGERGLSCAAGLFCDTTDESNPNCNSMRVGRCVPRPTSCTDRDIPTPVCGCDGETYRGDCERRLAGVARYDTGSCPRK